MPLPEEKRYTYADILTWGDDTRYELMNGVPYAMAGPSQAHQEILLEIAGQLRDYLKDKPCKVFIAPFDVRLNANTFDDTVVQPDVFVVCDKTKLDGKSCVGAPDMIIEILSPSTLRHDRLEKFYLYLKAGVREYWIVDPESKTVQAHLLKDGGYSIAIYGDTDSAPVHVLENFQINLADVFAG